MTASDAKPFAMTPGMIADQAQQPIMTRDEAMAFAERCRQDREENEALPTPPLEFIEEA